MSDKGQLIKGDMGELAAAEAEARGKSFIEELFVGKVNYSLLTPNSGIYEEPETPDDYATPKEVDEFLAALTAACLKYTDPITMHDTRQIPDEFIAEFRRLKATAIKVPKKYGGLGFKQFDYHRVLKLLSTFSHDLVALVSPINSIGVINPVLKWGTEEQKERILAGQVAGDISGFAITTDEGGCNVTRSSIHALRVYDEARNITGYRTYGKTRWTTNPPKNDSEFLADNLILIARVVDSVDELEDPERKKRFVALVIRTDQPGVSIAQRREFSGFGAMYNGDVLFEGVSVDVANRLGKDDPNTGEHDGMKVAFSTLEAGRLSVGAASVGSMKYAFDIALWWARKRDQWGIPIIKHELVGREKVLEIASNLYALESMVDLCAQLYDQGNDIRLEAAIVKVVSTEMSRATLEATVRVRGGRGIETGASLEAGGEERSLGFLGIALTSSIAPCIFEGTNQVMTLWPFKGATEIYMKRLIGVMKKKESFASFAIWLLGKQWARHIYSKEDHVLRNKSQRLKGHLKFVEKLAVSLKRTTIKAMMQHQKNLEREQVVVAELVRVSQLLFAMTCVCMDAARKSADDNDIRIELADYFCIQARKKLVPPNGQRYVSRPYKDQVIGWITRSSLLDEQILEDPARVLAQRLIKRVERGDADFLLDSMINPMSTAGNKFSADASE